MNSSRINTIEDLAYKGQLDELAKLISQGHTQFEIDVALEQAIAYSQIPIAEYLLTLGADFSNNNYNGVYYAVHNNEIHGLQFAISKGVDVNVLNGMLINVSIESAINTKNVRMVEWLLEQGADANLLTKESLQLVNDFGTLELKALLKNVT